MKWIALSERKPTAEDCWVLVRWSDGVTTQCHWDSAYVQSATHWFPIRDIELPPPAPVMPERLEFVKCKPGEEGGVGAIAVENDTGKAFHAHYADTQDDWCKSPAHTLYRRVEPGKWIVFEVGEKRPPKKGEWHIPLQTDLGPACAINDFDRPRTILRLVEGEEYLK